MLNSQNNVIKSKRKARRMSSQQEKSFLSHVRPISRRSFSPPVVRFLRSRWEGSWKKKRLEDKGRSRLISKDDISLHRLGLKRIELIAEMTNEQILIHRRLSDEWESRLAVENLTQSALENSHRIGSIQRATQNDEEAHVIIRLYTWNQFRIRYGGTSKNDKSCVAQ